MAHQVNAGGAQRQHPARHIVLYGHEGSKRTVTFCTDDSGRRRHERYLPGRLFQVIRASDHHGCYSRVTDFIRTRRQGAGKTASKSAFMPLQFMLGEAVQIDWSEKGLVVDGI